MRYKIKLRDKPEFEVEGKIHLFNSSNLIQVDVNERYAISLNSDDVVFIKKVEDKEEQNIMYFSDENVNDVLKCKKNLQCLCGEFKDYLKNTKA
jgi:hypothetical protein